MFLFRKTGHALAAPFRSLHRRWQSQRIRPTQSVNFRHSDDNDNDNDNDNDVEWDDTQITNRMQQSTLHNMGTQHKTSQIRNFQAQAINGMLGSEAITETVSETVIDVDKVKSEGVVHAEPAGFCHDNDDHDFDGGDCGSGGGDCFGGCDD